MSESSKYILSVRHGTLLENLVIPNIWLHLEMPFYDFICEIWITIYSRDQSLILICCCILRSNSYDGRISWNCWSGTFSSVTVKIGSWSAPRSHETVLIGSVAFAMARKNGRIFIIFIISLFYSLEYSTLVFSVNFPKVSPDVFILTFRLL